MGSITSRLNFEALQANRQRSQQDETFYSYSLNKNYFSNYFLMGGERFEVNDPDYLFGDSCDLNFLSCTKPCSLPYKKAQQDLIANLNTRQKASNKSVSSRVDRLSSPLNLLTGRHRDATNLRAKQQDAQTQTSKNGVSPLGSEPSKPLVMLINIRKETLRLVKSTTTSSSVEVGNGFSDQVGISTNKAVEPHQIKNSQTTVCKLIRRKSSTSKSSRRNSTQYTGNNATNNPLQHSASNRHSTISSRAADINPSVDFELRAASLSSRTGATNKNPLAGSSSLTATNLTNTSFNNRADVGSIASNESSCSTRSGGYTSVKDAPMLSDNNSVNHNEDDASTGSTDEEFKDALNDTINISIKSEDVNDYDEDDDDTESERLQQQKSLLLNESANATNDVRIIIEPQQHNQPQTDKSLLGVVAASNNNSDNIGQVDHSKTTTTEHLNAKGDVDYADKSKVSNISSRMKASHNKSSQEATSRKYNIEFRFDSEVECSIGIFYFCTREFTSNGITYKPQHVTFKSKMYNYSKGLNQNFDQKDHVFSPQLFDDDLLVYRPLDMDGNYIDGAVFPVVIHMVALEGPLPRQSQSLVATIERSQLDDSFSIKPLKQIIFADGVQYILQDIYGIEHKRLTQSESPPQPSLGRRIRSDRSPTLSRASSNASLNQQHNMSRSIQSNLNTRNYYDTVSLRSSIEFTLDNRDQNRASFVSNSNYNQHRSLVSEANTFECVICMSEERDTMLLPCRHLCLCSTCAQSLRYQANSCPICRCPFKAALNLRPMSQRMKSQETPMDSTRLKPLGNSGNITAASNQNRSQVIHHKSSSSLKTKVSTDAMDCSTSSRQQIAETDLSVTQHPGGHLITSSTGAAGQPQSRVVSLLAQTTSLASNNETGRQNDRSSVTEIEA